MSRKKGGGGDFKNIVAQRWRNINKIPLMSQHEIVDLLNRDIKEMLLQVTCARRGILYQGRKIGNPEYIANGFANLATAYWFYQFVRDNVEVKKGYIRTNLTKDQVKSLKAILADAYGKSLGGVYQMQAQDDEERNMFLSKAFVMLEPRVYEMSKRLDGLSKAGRRELAIQIYGDPVYKMRYVHRKMNDSTVSDKKKLKFLKRAYGKRYIAAVGAAMTTEGNGSDCLSMLFDDMMNVKKKKRGPYIQAYAEAYKKNGPARYFRMDRNFYDKNKKLIRLLIGTKKHPEWAIDVGYRKAFKDMKAGKAPEHVKKDGNKKKDIRTNNFNRQAWEVKTKVKAR